MKAHVPGSSLCLSTPHILPLRTLQHPQLGAQVRRFGRIDRRKHKAITKKQAVARNHERRTSLQATLVHDYAQRDNLATQHLPEHHQPPQFPSQLHQHQHQGRGQHHSPPPVEVQCGIFWDMENVRNDSYPPAIVIEAIRDFAGSRLTPVFQAYLSTRAVQNIDNRLHAIYSQLGVTFIQCHSLGKDTADKKMISDMWKFYASFQSHAANTPLRIILITSDRDFADAIGQLRNLGVEVRILTGGISQTAPVFDDYTVGMRVLPLLGVIETRAKGMKLDNYQASRRLDPPSISNTPPSPPPSPPPMQPAPAPKLANKPVEVIVETAAEVTDKKEDPKVQSKEVPSPFKEQTKKDDKSQPSVIAAESKEKQEKLENAEKAENKDKQVLKEQLPRDNVAQKDARPMPSTTDKPKDAEPQQPQVSQPSESTLSASTTSTESKPQNPIEEEQKPTDPLKESKGIMKTFMGLFQRKASNVDSTSSPPPEPVAEAKPISREKPESQANPQPETSQTQKQPEPAQTEKPEKTDKKETIPVEIPAEGLQLLEMIYSPPSTSRTLTPPIAASKSIFSASLLRPPPQYKFAPPPQASSLRVQSYKSTQLCSTTALLEHYSKEVLALKPKEVDDHDMNRLFNAWVQINSWSPEEFSENSVRRAAVMALGKAGEIAEVRRKEKLLREEDERLDFENERERLIISGLLEGNKENQWYPLTSRKDFRGDEMGIKETERVTVLKETSMKVSGKERAVENKGGVDEAVTTTSETATSQPETSREADVAKQDDSKLDLVTEAINKLLSRNDKTASQQSDQDIKDTTKETEAEQKPNIKQPPIEEPITVANVAVTLSERIPSQQNAHPPQ